MIGRFDGREDLATEIFGGPTVDHTEAGECSGCGECCNRILMVTRDELRRLRTYVRRHGITPVNHAPAMLMEPAIDLKCPFRDDLAGRCTVYPVRPEVCRRYTCSATMSENERRRRVHELAKRGGYHDRDVYQEIFNHR